MPRLAGALILLGAVPLLMAATFASGAPEAADPLGAAALLSRAQVAPAGPGPVLLPLGCPGCSTFGLGNTIPISQAATCPNCILTQQNYDNFQKFWLSINGPYTNLADGDVYNSYYDINGGYFGSCPPSITVSNPNPDYRGSGIEGGYNYGVHVENSPTDLTIYAYDPAQYYVQGASGTDFDTGDGEPCATDPTHPARFTTTFKLYEDPLNTPNYFVDDVQIGANISFTFANSQRDRWVPLWTLPDNRGDLRVQVTTDDNRGIGRNQYALALGGGRSPILGEMIYGINAAGYVLNIVPPGPGPSPTATQVAWFLTSVDSAHHGGQLEIRAFDPGDTICNTYVHLLRQDVACGGGDPSQPQCYNPVQFFWSAPGVPWTGPTDFVQTTDIVYPQGDPRRNPYNGQWVTLRVDLPSNYTTSWWKLAYSVSSCGASGGRGVADRTVWEAAVLDATATPSSTATATATETNTPTTTPPPTNTPAPTTMATASPTPGATVCPVQFNDVAQGSTFYEWIRCLACRGIVGGYPCGGPGEPCPGTYFRPNTNVTRGQLAKIIASTAGLADPVPSTQQTFADVPPGSTFWLWTEQLAGRGAIGGYPCGGPFEPCVAPGNRPYFRPNASATRGQIAKIVSTTAQYTETPTAQTFADVPPGSTFYLTIERLASRGIIGGYPCGGGGEPCVAPTNRPYFRPNNATTRGQMSKIAANTFLPNCQTPARNKK